MKNEQNPLPHFQQTSTAGQSDWITLTRQLWDGRIILMIMALAGILAGVAFIYLSKESYTAHTIMVPQTSSSGESQLSGLASLAGISLDMSQNGELSPVVYPKITNSITFKLELMYHTFNFTGYSKPVTLYEYFVHEKPADSLSESIREPILLTKNQIKVKKILDKNIFLSMDKKDGYLTLEVTMPEALAAAQVAQVAQELLQREVVRFKTEKAQANLNFIQERYDAVKAEAEKYQVNVVAGSDKFKDMVSNLPKVSNVRMQTKYNISNTVFQELAKQLEQAKIQVRKDTPVFTVVEPVSVPYQKNGAGKAFILIISLMLGIMAGVLAIFAKKSLSNFRERWHADRA